MAKKLTSKEKRELEEVLLKLKEAKLIISGLFHVRYIDYSWHKRMTTSLGYLKDAQTSLERRLKKLL